MNVNIPTFLRYLLPIAGLHQAIMIRATYRSRQVPPGYDTEVPPRNYTYPMFGGKDVPIPSPEVAALDKLFLANLFYLLPVIVTFVLLRLTISVLASYAAKLAIYNPFRTRHNNAQRDVSNRLGLFRLLTATVATTSVLTGAVLALGIDVGHLTGIPTSYLLVIIASILGDVLALYTYFSTQVPLDKVSTLATEQLLESSTDTLLPEPDTPDVSGNKRKSRKKKTRSARKQAARRTDFIVARQTGEDQDDTNYNADGELKAVPWRKILREASNASNIPRGSNRKQLRSHTQYVPSGRNTSTSPKPKATRTIEDLRKLLGVSRPDRPSIQATVNATSGSRRESTESAIPGPSRSTPGDVPATVMGQHADSAKENAVVSNEVPKIFVEGEEVNGSLSVPKSDNDDQLMPSPITPSSSSSVLMAESPFGPRPVDTSAQPGSSLELALIRSPAKRTRRTLEVVSPAPKRGTLAEKLHTYSQPKRYRNYSPSPNRPIVDDLPELPLTHISFDQSGFLPSLGSINELAEEEAVEEPEARAERNDGQMASAAAVKEDKFTFRYSIPLHQEHRPLRSLPARPPKASMFGPRRMDGHSDAWNPPKGLALGQNAVASVLGTANGGTMVLWSTVPLPKPFLRHVKPRLG